MPVPPLFLDVQATQEATSPERGIFRYVSMHAAALARIPGAVARFGYHPALPAPAHLPEELAGSSRLVPLTAREFRRVRADGPFAYHVMAPFHAYRPLDTGLPRFGVDGSVPLLATIYDFIPLGNREFYLRRAYDRHEYDCRMRLVAEADLLFALSQWTADETAAVLGVEPERVAVIGGGVSDAFHGSEDDAARRALLAGAAPQVRGDYLMTVGFTDTRKNLELLVRAYRELPDDLRTSLQIVFAGDLGPVYAERLRAEAADLGLDEDTIVIPGRIPEPQLRALYQSAALFVFPSLAEGFGLPVVEAIACGCPAILADSSALPEILEWPPALFDPADATSLAALIERALRDTAFRAELEAVCRAAMPRHTWDAVARRTIGALERVGQGGGHGHYTPARIALAGTVDAGLVRALRERIQVDRFVPGGRTAVEGARRAEGGGPVFVLGALGTSVSATQYDAVLHVVADGPDREAQHAATVRVPGPVVSATDLRRIDPDRLLAGVVAPAPVVPRVLGS